MTRKEVYDAIKARKLGEEVKKRWGLHYTQVKTELLEKLLKETEKKEPEKKEEPKCGCKYSHDYAKDNTINLIDKLFNKNMTDFATMVNRISNVINNAPKPAKPKDETKELIARLLGSLVAAHVLTQEECDWIWSGK